MNGVKKILTNTQLNTQFPNTSHQTSSCLPKNVSILVISSPSNSCSCSGNNLFISPASRNSSSSAMIGLPDSRESRIRVSHLSIFTCIVAGTEHCTTSAICFCRINARASYSMVIADFSSSLSFSHFPHSELNLCIQALPMSDPDF